MTTLAGYLTTLDESILLCGLHKYASDNARKYNSVPKLMVYNTALFSVQSGMSYNKAFTAPREWGRLLIAEMDFCSDMRGWGVDYRNQGERLCVAYCLRVTVYCLRVCSSNF